MKQILITDAIETLKGFIHNPGRFSILLLGATGVGKSHWINKHWEDSKIKYKGAVVVKHAQLLVGQSEDFFIDLIIKADKGVLVIDHVEHLGIQEQAILFNLMSTTNGKFGPEGNKNYEVRIVFTSTRSINRLVGRSGHENENHLTELFFNRIAQLVVQFPSFDSNPDPMVWENFKIVWGYMWKGIKPSPNIPSTEFRDWLKDNTKDLRGNYRDLETLAINWRHWQHQGLTDEKEIFTKVKTSFREFNHTPVQKEESRDVYYLDPEYDYARLLEGFKWKVREWSKQFGNPDSAAAKLNVSKRTMEKWMKPKPL